MKKFALALLAGLLMPAFAIAAPSDKKDRDKANPYNARVSRHELRTSGWESLMVNGSYNVTVRYNPDSVGYVTVWANQAMLDDLELINKGTQLLITQDNTDDKSRRFNSKVPKLMIVYCDSKMTSACLNGSGDLLIEPQPKLGSFKLLLNGSGDIVMRNTKFSKLDVSLNGSGDVKLADITSDTNLQLALSGSGDLSAKKVSAANLAVNMAGSGDIDVKDIKASKLSAAASGSGEIQLSGSCDSADLAVAGTSEIDAAYLKAKKVSARSKGLGGITVHPDAKLDADGDNINKSKKIKP